MTAAELVVAAGNSADLGWLVLVTLAVLIGGVFWASRS